MAFFLIVPSVMIVGVLLVHALANRLGLRIYYTTLIATAVLSFMVDITATAITPDVGRTFLLRLGLIILVAAFLLTLANRFLLKQQRDAEKTFTEEVKAAYEAEKNSPLITETPADFDWEAEAPPAKYNEELGIRNEELKGELPAQVKPSEPVKEPDSNNEELGIRNEELQGELSAQVKPSEPVKPKANVEPAKEFPLEKVFEALPEVKPEKLEEINDAEEKPELEKRLPLEEVFQPLSEVKPEKVELPKEPPKPEDNLPLQEVFKPLSTIKLEKLDSLPVEQPEESAQVDEPDEPETLDDILDKAYNERAKGHAWQAIELYRQALERYRNDEYAPFVAIDLGNIYKEQALYSKAIKIFEEALSLPAVTRNESIKGEFVKNLEYLRVVRDVLLKYHASSVPFGKLSAEILQEIDTEYQKAQRHSEQFK